MQYIIMAGGNYTDYWKKPKQLLKIDGEVLIERTIRLLKENNIKDIAISTNSHDFDYLGVKILNHKNDYTHTYHADYKKSKNAWLNAYYPTDKECCYLHGDVYFTNEAIKEIVNAEVKNTLFICTHRYWEPLGYKVVNQKKFRQAINELLKMIDNGDFKVDPISWNLYRYLNNIKLVYNGYGNDIFSTNGEYLEIKDFTNDIDYEKDIPILEREILKDKIRKGNFKMVRVKVLTQFTYRNFDNAKELIRAEARANERGTMFKGDTFLVDKDEAKYLTETADWCKQYGPLVEIIEVIPDKKEVKKAEPKKVTKKAKK